MKTTREQLEALEPTELFGEERWEEIRQSQISALAEEFAEQLSDCSDEELFGGDLEKLMEHEIDAQLETAEETDDEDEQATPLEHEIDAQLETAGETDDEDEQATPSWRQGGF